MDSLRLPREHLLRLREMVAGVEPELRAALEETIAAHEKAMGEVAVRIETIARAQADAVVNSAMIVSELEDTKERLTAEVARHNRSKLTIETLLATSAAWSGSDFFRLLVKHLASALGVKHILVGASIGDGRIRTLAVWSRDAHAENFTYSLEGTPCGEAFGRDVCLVPSGVRELFPEAAQLAELKAESYAGMPLFDPTGQPSGLLVALHDQPFDEPDFVRTLLSLFASRAGSELTRRLADIELECAILAAEAASESKSRFLANMSHEIRTPLNGVLGLASLLLDTTLGVEQKNYVETIRRSGEVLLRIINDILDFSKIEAGKLDLESLEVDLRALVDDVIDLVAEKAHAKSIRISGFVDASVPSFVLGDPVRLTQILTNLVGNAVKFTSEGEVEISMRALEENDDDIVIRVDVRDSGIGLTKHTLERLFAPFTQADDSTTRQFGGTGLGLAICKQLVELMHGRIAAESEMGQGSTFWFEVRLGRSNRIERPETPCPIERQTALLVDPNVAARHHLSSIIESWGAKVVPVDDCTAAQSVLEDPGVEVSLILIDVDIPEADLGALVARLQKDPAPLVIQLTPYSHESGAPIPKGVVRLARPVRRRQLESVLKDHLSAPGKSSDEPIRLASQEPTALHVLLVEDNLVNQKVAGTFLKKLGCRVELASDGSAAVELCSDQRFDLIFMDCQMPGMDGFEATRQIRAAEGDDDDRVPIIALTANAMKGDRERCLECGMDDYLTKPVTPAQVAIMLEKWRPSQAPSRQDGRRPEGRPPV
ncbi:MAG: response regulator [Planctomycetota bacterium]